MIMNLQKNLKSKQKQEDDEESSSLVIGSTELSTIKRRQAGQPQESTSSLTLFEQDEEPTQEPAIKSDAPINVE